MCQISKATIDGGNQCGTRVSAYPWSWLFSCSCRGWRARRKPFRAAKRSRTFPRGTPRLCPLKKNEKSWAFVDFGALHSSVVGVGFEPVAWQGWAKVVLGSKPIVMTESLQTGNIHQITIHCRLKCHCSASPKFNWFGLSSFNTFHIITAYFLVCVESYPAILENNCSTVILALTK